MNNQTNLLSLLTGHVTIPMTNDYLFRALLQRNPKVLRGLLCSLLRMKEEEIISVTITNPVILGEAVNHKEFFLDINLVLNNQTRINLEMQVINRYDWPERSLSYLCRNFDNLNRGSEYTEVKAAIQIGLLDFTLFPEHPEFYAKYQLLNVHNFTKYSDKIGINVLDLTQIGKATDEDRAYRLDCWAALFKATTWEEIRMLAEKDEVIRDAAVTIAQLTQEEKVRLQCEAREDYYRSQRALAIRLGKQEEEIAKRDIILEEKDVAIAEKDAEIAQKDAEIAEKDAAIAKKDVEIAEKDDLIAVLQAQLATKEKR